MNSYQIGIALALIGSIGGAARSQQPNAASAPTIVPQSASSSRCFRPRRLDECRTYIVFNLGAAPRVTGTSHRVGLVPTATRPDLDNFGAWDIGYMRNRDATHAIGGFLHLGFSEQGVRLGLEARRRTWLSREFALDVAAGPITVQQQDLGGHPGTSQTYGLTSEAALSVDGLTAVTLGLDGTSGRGHRATALHVGIQLQAETAVVGTAVIGAMGILVLEALGHGRDFAN